MSSSSVIRISPDVMSSSSVIRINPYPFSQRLQPDLSPLSSGQTFPNYNIHSLNFHGISSSYRQSPNHQTAQASPDRYIIASQSPSQHSPYRHSPYRHSPHQYGDNRQDIIYPCSPRNTTQYMYPGPFSPELSRTMSPICYSPLRQNSKENDSFRDVPNCRRRLDFNHSTFDDCQNGQVAVAKRNERERNRVRLINTTFQTLRQHLPPYKIGSKSKSRKLSKVQTLRSAIEYIRKLQDLMVINTPKNRISSDISESEQKECCEKSYGIHAIETFYRVYAKDHEEDHREDKLEHKLSPSSYPYDKTRISASPGFYSVPTNCSINGQTRGSTTPVKEMTYPEYSTESYYGSPTSESSVYDCATTSADEEFTEFDDWM